MGNSGATQKKYRMRCIPPQRYCFFSGAPTFSTPHFCPPRGVISPQRGNRRRLLPNKRAKTGNFRPKTGSFLPKARSFSSASRGGGSETRRRMNRNANIRFNARHHSRLCRIARASPRAERGAGPHFSGRTTDWCTRTCAGGHTYTGLSLSAFLLYRKNIRAAQAGTRRSVRPTLLKIKHLRLAGKGPRKSPEKR